jgi:hypothetical protein
MAAEGERVRVRCKILRAVVMFTTRSEVAFRDSLLACESNERGFCLVMLREGRMRVGSRS